MSDRFRFQQHDGGQAYVLDGSDNVLSLDLSDPRCPVVQVGSHHTLIVDKLYGPLVGFPIRISIDGDDWRIERQAGDETWTEAARVPLQLESDFTEDTDAG